nr:MAG: wsv079-like protein [Sesarmops intermedium nimavirus]
MANDSDVMVDGEKKEEEENRDGTKTLTLPVCIVCHEEYDTEKDVYNWIPGGLPCCSQSVHLKCFSHWRFNNRNVDGKNITTCPVCRAYVPAVWFFEVVYSVVESFVLFENFFRNEIAVDEENGRVALEKLKDQAPIFFTGHGREPSMSVQVYLKNEKEKFEKFTLRSERTEKRENGVRDFEKNYKHARQHSFKDIPPLTTRWDDEDDFVDPPPDATDDFFDLVELEEDGLPDLINGPLGNNNEPEPPVNNNNEPSVNYEELFEPVDNSELVELSAVEVYEPMDNFESVVNYDDEELPDSTTNEPLVINYSWDEENETGRRESEERRRMEEELLQARREMFLFERRRRRMETEEAVVWLEARKEEEEARRKRKEEEEARKKRKEEEEARKKREKKEAEARRKRKEEEAEARRKRKEEEEGRCRIKQQERQRHTAAMTKRRWRIEKRRVSIDNKINHQLHILSSITPSRLSETLKELTSLGRLLEKQKKAIQELKKMKEARNALVQGIDEFISTASRARWEKNSDHITSALQDAKDSSKDLKEEIRILKIMRDNIQRKNTGGVNKFRQLSVPFLPIFNE